MVTILDAAFLSNFTVIFSMILVMAIVYGILEWSKTLGESKGLHILIAFVVGMLVLAFPDVSQLIGTMIPWFTILFIFILFVLIAYKIFGATDEDISGVITGGDRTIIWVIVIICIIIVIGSFSAVYGQRFLAKQGNETASTTTTSGGEISTATSSFSQNISATFFHPKVLGFILILLIAVFAMAILAMNPSVR